MESNIGELPLITLAFLSLEVIDLQTAFNASTSRIFYLCLKEAMERKLLFYLSVTLMQTLIYFD